MMSTRFPLQGLGGALRAARLERHLSLEQLAGDLHWSIPQLEAMEQDDWEGIPPGQERAMARQVAARLAFDLEGWAATREDWEEPTEDLPTGRTALERATTLGLAASVLAALAWLVIPGPSLRQDRAPEGRSAPLRPAGPVVFQVPHQPFGVLGEAIPEAPVTHEGVLITLRCTEPCRITVSSEGGEGQHLVQVGQPWRLRLKGPFRITLDNAGVAALDVAGRPIRHGMALGEAWSGSFDAQGAWLQPPGSKPAPLPPADEEPEEEEEEA